MSQASEAPAANSASRTPGHSRGSRSSTFASSTTGPDGAGVGRLAQHQADDVRQLDRVAAARARADALDPHRRAARSTRPPARPAVPRRSACTSRPPPGRRRPGRPAAARARPGRGSGRRRARRGPTRCPARRARRCSRSRPRCSNPATTPTTSASASRAPTSWKCTSSGGTRCTRPSATASRSNTASAPSRTGVGRSASSRSARTSAQVRCSADSAGVHVHPGGAQAVPGDLLGHQPDRSTGERGDRGGRHVERHAGVDQRAEQHVARRARREVQPADHADHASRRDRPSGSSRAGGPGGDSPVTRRGRLAGGASARRTRAAKTPAE